MRSELPVSCRIRQLSNLQCISVTSPGSSEHADGISSPERKRRAEMEYGEDDEPDPVVEEVLEASAQIPNIPVPRSADGSVSLPSFLGSLNHRKSNE